ncbi:preprotein translocase subunit SecE [Dietzia sp. PP-33]|uniref:preprotein translocase subunit SecE n=1 Tax=Dietzia sp. PP-33 TaxID=2957500 RepID=UPI0029BB5C1C|nr:preprotein translocase subunit SecE [Dietzia sp. PP-33]MDX2358208.1 preprotein translocase subunit SecE [Dietzia sp. PP-33]
MSQDRDDDVDTSGARDSDGAAASTGSAVPAGSAVPTGKAGRGDTAVAGRVRTDADTAEDTRGNRANPFQYIGQVVEELRKVIWPTRNQMVTYTIVVFLFLIFMTALVSGVDFGAGKLVELVFDR